MFAEKRGCRAGATAGPARAAFRQNEMAVDLKYVDLKDVDLKDVDLKDIDLKSPPARQNERVPGLALKRPAASRPIPLIPVH